MKLERAQVDPSCARLCEPQNPAEPWWNWNGGSKSAGFGHLSGGFQEFRRARCCCQCIAMHEFPACARWLGRRAISFRFFEFPGWAVQTSQRQAFWRILKSLQTWGRQWLAESFWTRERAPCQSLLGERRCPTHGSDTFSDCIVLLALMFCGMRQKQFVPTLCMVWITVPMVGDGQCTVVLVVITVYKLLSAIHTKVRWSSSMAHEHFMSFLRQGLN